MHRYAAYLFVIALSLVHSRSAALASTPEDAAPPASAEQVAQMIERGGDDWNIALALLRSDPCGGKWVRELAKHSNPKVRVAAVMGIRLDRLSEFEDCLRSLLDDPAEDVWRLAWARLVDLGTPDVLEHMKDSLERRGLPTGVVGMIGPVRMAQGAQISFDWSPDGKYIAVSGEYEGVTIWDSRKLSVHALLRTPHEGEVGTPSWSPDGRAVGVVDTLNDRVLVWRRSTEGKWSVWEGMGRAAPTAENLAWWPSQRVIVSGIHNCLVAWDMESGRLCSRLEGLRVGEVGLHSIAASRHGDVLAAVDGQRVLLFRSIERAEIRVTFGASVALSPSGDRLAVIGRYGNVSVWDVARMRRLWIDRPDAEMPVLDVDFSPDGSRIAQAGVEGIVVRNALTGEPVASYPCRVGRIWQLRWTPTGGRIATNGPRGVVFVWKLSPTPQAADRETAADLRTDARRLRAGLAELWQGLASSDLALSGSAERLLAALGDPAARWIAERIRERDERSLERGIDTRLLRAVSVLAFTVGTDVEAVLDRLQDECKGHAELHRLLVWAIETRREE